MPSLGERLKHAWNAFNNPIYTNYSSLGAGNYYRPDRPKLTRGNERSIVNAIINRIAMDVASITIQHVRIDQNGGVIETIDDSLNNILTLEANKDQTSRFFIQDAVMSLLDEGHVALVPIDTTINPSMSSSYQIETMRTGRVVQWYPDYVRVDIYNDRTGRHEERTLPKQVVALIENPLASVMNEPNSTLQRLIRKLNLLDAIDEQSGAGKLDLLIQLPYTLKTDYKREQAEIRRKQIEDQLMGTKYGIAYIDSTEHVTQLNRSLDNNLMKQIEYLTTSLYNQLGITEAVFNGTADEQVMLNYNNRTVEPIASAIVDEMKRKFLTKTARTQGQSIVFFKDPFRLVPVNNLAEIADKFTRNEILSPNEIRKIIGFRPVQNEHADELRNRNLNKSENDESPVVTDESPDSLSNDSVPSSEPPM